MAPGHRTTVDEHCRRLPAEPLRPYVAWYTGYRQRGIAPATPKSAARVIRFHRARHLLVARVAAGDPVRLVDLAMSCGYFDQAHLAREFRALAGVPPSQWLAEEFRNVQADAWLSAGAWTD